MSFVFHLNNEAGNAVRACDIWLQEAIYDELDLLAADPSKLKLRGSRQWGVHDFDRVHDRKLYTVFITIQMNRQGHILHVFRIGYVVAEMP